MTEVAIVEKASASNGAIVITLRPNGDPAHDSRHTIYTAGITPAALREWLADCKVKVVADYEAHQNAHALLDGLV